MDKVHPWRALMIDHSFDVEKDIFQPKKNNEKLLGLEVPYLSTIVV